MSLRLPVPALAALALVLVAAGEPGVQRRMRSRRGRPASAPSCCAPTSRSPTTYSRTPSFAWAPVAAGIGGHYQFQIATSQELPGRDARVQGHERSAASRDGAAAASVGDRLRRTRSGPTSAGSRRTGRRRLRGANPSASTFSGPRTACPHRSPLLKASCRWAPIDGATAYEVLYTDLHPAQSFQTTTNVADEREFFTWHTALGYSDDPLARPGDPRCRPVPELDERSAGSLVRPVEPRLHHGEHTTDAGTLEGDSTRSRMSGTRLEAVEPPTCSHPGFAWSPSTPAPSSDRASSSARASTASTSSPTRTA